MALHVPKKIPGAALSLVVKLLICVRLREPQREGLGALLKIGSQGTRTQGYNFCRNFRPNAQYEKNVFFFQTNGHTVDNNASKKRVYDLTFVINVAIIY